MFPKWPKLEVPHAWLWVIPAVILLILGLIFRDQKTVVVVFLFASVVIWAFMYLMIIISYREHNRRLAELRSFSREHSLYEVGFLAGSDSYVLRYLIEKITTPGIRSEELGKAILSAANIGETLEMLFYELSIIDPAEQTERLSSYRRHVLKMFEPIVAQGQVKIDEEVLAKVLNQIHMSWLFPVK